MALLSFLSRSATPALAFLRHVFIYFLPAALFGYIPPYAALPANMPRAKGTKAVDLAGPVQRRGMVHVKTKEECRLANETVDVWSIELPSKHAESILKCVLTIYCHRRH